MQLAKRKLGHKLITHVSPSFGPSRTFAPVAWGAWELGSSRLVCSEHRLLCIGEQTMFGGFYSDPGCLGPLSSDFTDASWPASLALPSVCTMRGPGLFIMGKLSNGETLV